MIECGADLSDDGLTALLATIVSLSRDAVLDASRDSGIVVLTAPFCNFTAH
jgi:hypothetical protein